MSRPTAPKASANSSKLVIAPDSTNDKTFIISSVTCEISLADDDDILD